MAQTTTTTTEKDLLPLPFTTDDPAPGLISSLTSIADDSTTSSITSSLTTEPTRTPPKKRRRTSRNEPHVINTADDIDDDEVLLSVSSHAEDHDPAVGTPAETITSTTSTPPEPESLSNYLCPICFSPPTNATLTPCGHVCCGECLFTAVRTTLRRAIAHASPEPPLPRCPVCRAELKGWDGKGGGVIGLKVRTVFTL